MKNMFSNNTKKHIPNDFKECYKTDSITENLWVWAERLEKWGGILFFILIIVGILDTVFSTITTTSDTVAIYVVSNALLWGLYAFIEYCAYHVIALLVGSLATIVQNTKITANIALYNAAKNEPATKDITPAPINDGWTCNSCGATNNKTDTRCKNCGTSELFND